MAGFDRHLIIVVNAVSAVTANAHAKVLDHVGGDKTFTVRLSPTGNLPATHYWCGWQMTGPEDAQLRGRLTALVARGRAQILDGTTTTPDEVLTTLGLKRIEVPRV